MSGLRQFGMRVRRIADEAVFGALQTLRATGHASLSGFLALKQNDQVAYPLHVATAKTLEAVNCPTDAIWIQWLKAGIHARQEAQVEVVASALRARVRGADDAADLRDLVLGFVERESWSDGIHRIRTALVPTIGP
jgi:hypothetical protein